MNTVAHETNYRTATLVLHTPGKMRRILGRADYGKPGSRAQVKEKQKTEA